MIMRRNEWESDWLEFSENPGYYLIRQKLTESGLPNDIVDDSIRDIFVHGWFRGTIFMEKKFLQ